MDAGIRLYEGPNVAWHIFNSAIDNGLRIWNGDVSEEVLFADQNTGYVGIGTINPSARLNVETNYGFSILGKNTSGNCYGGVGGTSSGVSGITQGAYDGVVGFTNGTGDGIYGYSYNGNGSAAHFFHDTQDGAVDAVRIINRTDGSALFVQNIFDDGIALNVTLHYGSGYVGYFDGNVHVTGLVSKGAGSFLIDHPQDPENKFLRHNFVESPENLLIYRDKVKLDENGEAIVHLPGYFESLSRENEATITLTSVGKPFLTGYEWQDGFTSFKAYGDPGRTVSWVVFADRDDPVIHELGKPVEEDKKPDDQLCSKGKLLYPKAYGYPETKGRDYISDAEVEKEREKARRLKESTTQFINK